MRFEAINIAHLLEFRKVNTNKYQKKERKTNERMC